jgi:hypothetical protein
MFRWIDIGNAATEPKHANTERKKTVEYWGDFNNRRGFVRCVNLHGKRILVTHLSARVGVETAPFFAAHASQEADPSSVAPKGHILHKIGDCKKTGRGMAVALHSCRMAEKPAGFKWTKKRAFRRSSSNKPVGKFSLWVFNAK